MISAAIGDDNIRTLIYVALREVIFRIPDEASGVRKLSVRL